MDLILEELIRLEKKPNRDFKEKVKLIRKLYFDKATETITFKKLEKAHACVSKYLQKVRPMEHTVTGYEHIFYKNLKKVTRYRAKRSFLIMNHVIDLFFPQFSLAVEIDGKIHDLSEAKMRKDNFRFKRLEELNIVGTSIKNEDISKDIFTFMANFSSMKRLCSKTEKRRLRDIYISTIALHWNFDQIAAYFGISGNFKGTVLKESAENSLEV